MKMKGVLLLIVASVLLFMLPVWGWSNYTTVYIAKAVLLESYPRCAEYIERGALTPIKNEAVDPILGEPINMHCDTLTCPAFDPNYCQTGLKSCASEVKSGEVKSEARPLCDCEQAEKLAEAITYFIAKYSPMNLMIRESKECREGFENAVEEAIKSGNTSWSIAYKCDMPDREFTFTSKKVNEIIDGAKSFAFAEAFAGTQKWYCYTLGGEIVNGSLVIDNETEGLKEDGALCSSGLECMSGHCDNNVCCADGKVCCPVPGVKGYPCKLGEVCNDKYTCEKIQLGMGEKCSYNEDCSSGNCRPGTRSVINKYCCANGNEYCCASDDDCLEGEVCNQSTCMPIPVEGQNQTNGGLTQEEIEEIKRETCIPIVILLGAALGLWAIAKKK
ncbi:MAG: hypothetical protein ACP5H8_01940 [Candidatus Micrarchaeia archaeon]